MNKKDLVEIRKIMEVQLGAGKRTVQLNETSFEELLLEAEKAQELKEQIHQMKNEELGLDQDSFVWKAFEVFYNTGGKSDSATVLVNAERNIEHALSAKDADFKLGSRYSEILMKKEIPLTSVKVSDLSLTDLIGILKSVK